jgi:hypothetical protein
MKKFASLILVLTYLSLNAVAQEISPKINEIGFNVNGSQFGVRYSTGNEVTLLRLTLLSLYGNSTWDKTPGDESTNNQQGVGFNVGFEKRKSIAENISLFLGSDLLTSLETDAYKFKSTDNKYTSTTLSIGVGFVVGINFKVADRIYISTEFVPAIVYSHSAYKSQTQFEDVKTTNNGINYGLSTRGINLTLSCRLNK